MGQRLHVRLALATGVGWTSNVPHDQGAADGSRLRTEAHAPVTIPGPAVSVALPALGHSHLDALVKEEQGCGTAGLSNTTVAPGWKAGIHRMQARDARVA